MPYQKKNLKFEEEYLNNTRSESKKILIEQTTLTFIVSIIAFKTITLLLPDDVSVLYSALELLSSIPSDPRVFPLFIGFSLSFLTWHVMYLDSAIPGVEPPTPLSPRKYREASGADFHLNFVFAMIIGPIVAASIYAGWV